MGIIDKLFKKDKLTPFLDENGEQKYRTKRRFSKAKLLISLFMLIIIISAFSSDTHNGEASSNDKAIISFKDLSVSKKLDHYSSEYTTIELSAVINSTKTLNYISLWASATDINNKVLANTYMNGLNNGMDANREYSITGEFLSKDFTWDDVAKVEFGTGSGTNKVILETWTKK
jgi:hypothetical protein